MKDPVRGVFRVTGFYDAHPHSSPPGTRITGVIVAPGMPATPAEHKVDGRHWADSQELPVLVDRSDPSRFVVLRDEVKPVSWQDRERQAAQAEADRLNATASNAADGAPHTAGDGSPFGFDGPAEVAFDDVVTVGPAEVAFDDVMTVGPDGQVHNTTLPPEAAAGVEAAVRQVLEGLGPTLAGESSATPYGGVNPVEAARMVASKSGERATAIVVAVTDKKPRFAALAPPGGMADLTLEVTRADGSIYTAHSVIGFSTQERRSIVAVVGKRLNVFIDPSTPTKIAIDTAGLF